MTFNPRHPALLLGVTIMTLGVFAAPSPARASSACVTAYETAADDYWRIVSDMTQFKVMFDNYSQLCEKYYPEEIKKLQPAADKLRTQTAKDMKDAPRVIDKIFTANLSASVPPACAKDIKARNKALQAFQANMKSRSKALAARMKKSGATLRDPQDSLKLCRDLPDLAPKIQEKLGPDLAMPLLTMSELNSQYMVKDSEKLQKAFEIYRTTLQNLPSKKWEKKGAHQ